MAQGSPSDLGAVAVPLRLATVHGPLSFLGTTTVFGRAVDITLAELAIEALLPADQATRAAMRRMAAEPMPAPATASPLTPRAARRAASG
jgi:hypothetical protein